MLKGMHKSDVEFSTEKSHSIANVSVRGKSLSLQDSSNTNKSKVQQLDPQISLPRIGITSQKKIDSIFLKNDLREKVIRAKNIKIQNQVIPVIKSGDTISNITQFNHLLTQHANVNDLYSNNFLLGISHKNISQNFDTSLIPHKNVIRLIEKQQNSVLVKQSIDHERTGFNGNIRTEVSLDWLPGILLLSLFTFSWIKLLYHKYVVQVVASLVNYQASIRLFRERNVLFRNMAIGLNFVFAINIGLFIYYIIQYNELRQIIAESKFLSVLIYSTAIILIYNVKTFACKVLGNIFMVKEQFSEYVHNIYLYNKNIGLFLFPIIILFPYITNGQIKPIVLYSGLTIVVGMSLLLIYRGFQIIMRNGVSIFYLILYLCAIEILPVLLLIKYSFTSI